MSVQNTVYLWSQDYEVVSFDKTSVEKNIDCTFLKNTYFAKQFELEWKPSSYSDVPRIECSADVLRIFSIYLQFGKFIPSISRIRPGELFFYLVRFASEFHLFTFMSVIVEYKFISDKGLSNSPNRPGDDSSNEYEWSIFRVSSLDTQMHIAEDGELPTQVLEDGWNFGEKVSKNDRSFWIFKKK